MFRFARQRGARGGIHERALAELRAVRERFHHGDTDPLTDVTLTV